MTRPLTSELRIFGLMFSAIIVAIATALLVFTAATIAVWVWVIPGVVTLLALVAPQALRPLYHAWMWLGHWLQWVNTYVVLALLFFLIITPIGLVMRLFGYDPMQHKRRPDSYRQLSEARAPDHVEKPY